MTVLRAFSDRWFFLYGFEKNERDDIDRDELKVFHEMAKELLQYNDRQLAIALSAGEIFEARNGNSQTQKPDSGRDA